MLVEGVKRFPVVEAGRLVGIVTRHDVLRVFDRPDDAIDAEIRARLAGPRYSLEDPAVTFSVNQGVVTLEGSVYYEGDGTVIEGIVREVPGVVAVDSKLTYLEPTSSML
jgi:CBS domain-containing protein